MDRKTLGYFGEQLAREYLESLGYIVLQQNYHSRYGEIDLIASKDSSLAFVEVKTRSSNSYGLGLEAVDQRKICRSIKTIYSYLNKRKKNINWRLDIITIQLKKDYSLEHIDHYKNIS